MRARIPEMMALANGSTFLELSRKNFKEIPVRLAPDDLVMRFDAEVDRLHNRAASSSEETAVLTELRDTLLPKLMTGEIQVRDAEKVVEEAV
jgi:type I restriction enzyme S subunit